MDRGHGRWIAWILMCAALLASIASAAARKPPRTGGNQPAIMVPDAVSDFFPECGCAMVSSGSPFGVMNSVFSGPAGAGFCGSGLVC